MELSAMNHTSALGKPFVFSLNSSGTYITSSSSTTRVVDAHAIVSDGVVDIIDICISAQSITKTGAVGETTTGSGSSDEIKGAANIDLPIQQLLLVFILMHHDRRSLFVL
jgi:hypothetical protein